ncbi:MAG: MarP family serine protease [Candidatus Nanopelagicales bacterium]|jgi:S1-C subfamily serine protease|nr:MarP family serine protease [Candidatus Nanopelagicales bacterium]MCU0297381.1 MarP family serine protease [Candidatus Nanopelagicales bacterium]
MGVVDLIILGMLGLVALIGWHQGLVRSVFSVVGTVGGGLVAAACLPWVLRELGALGPVAAAVSVGVILLGVGIGNALAVTLGRPIWGALQDGPARTLDAAAGALVSVVAGLVAMWLVAATVTALPSQRLSAAVRSSTLLAQVERLVPAQATDLAYSVRELLDQVHLPEVFFGLEGLPGDKVAPPPKNVPAAAVTASQSVVRVSGPTPACGQGSTGSGFVYATDYIATNAHVVAGMSQVRVVASDGRSWGADVVFFDADLDVAVLFVPGLGLTPLSAARNVEDGEAAVIAGYPGGGPLDLRSARVVTRTSESPVFSDNIYGSPTKPREIFVVRGRIIPGNSGGPLLTRDGRYAGVIFASSQQYDRTGFALTNKAVGQSLEKAAGRVVPVETGQCSR